MTNEQKLDKIRECVEGYFKDVAKHGWNPCFDMSINRNVLAAGSGYGWMTEIEVHLGEKNDE